MFKGRAIVVKNVVFVMMERALKLEIWGVESTKGELLKEVITGDGAGALQHV